jgi:hypothetical protein
MVYFTTFPRGALEDNKKAHHIILAKVSFFHLILKGYNAQWSHYYRAHGKIRNISDRDLKFFLFFSFVNMIILFVAVRSKKA